MTFLSQLTLPFHRRQPHRLPPPARALRGELRSLGGEVLRDPPERQAAIGVPPLRRRRRSLVPGEHGRSAPRDSTRNANSGCASSCARPIPRRRPAFVGEPGINITRLIELFSRRPRAEQPQWTLDAGPLRLADLRRPKREAREAGEPASQPAHPDLPGGDAGPAGRHPVDHHHSCSNAASPTPPPPNSTRSPIRSSRPAASSTSAPAKT